MPLKNSFQLTSLSLLIIVIFLFSIPYPAFSQDQEAEANRLEKITEDSRKEIDFYSLEELLNVEVEVASLFMEDELVVGSTVSSITPDKWKRLGARRNFEALNNEMGVQTYPAILGFYDISIRGYKGSASSTGISYMLDGVQLNDFVTGAIYQVPNWELGTLDRIEVIKGPGSAIYGSYAFNGVLSMKTFESDKDMISVEAAAVSPNPQYYDGNVKISEGFLNNFLRIDAAAAASRQRNLDQEYVYNDNLYNKSGTGIQDANHDSQVGILKLRINPENKLNGKISGYVSHFKADDYPGVGVSPVGSLENKDATSVDCLYILGKGEASYTAANKISVEAMANYMLTRAEQNITVRPDGTVNIKNQEGYGGEAKLLVKQPDNAINLQWLIAYDCLYINKLSANTKVESNIPVFNIPESDELFDGFNRTINSVFGQAKWGAVKDTLYIIAGLRMDNYSDFGSQFTPRGGLILLPTKKSSVKALYGRGFRAPVANEIKGMKLFIKPNPDLEPETIDEYELCYIYKEKSWKINSSIFYSRWNDAIISIMLPNDLNYQMQYTNQGKNQAYGGEINLYYSFTFPVAVELGFAYVKSSALDVIATNDDRTPKLDSDGNVIKEDVDFSSFPEYSANAGLYYTLKPYEINFYLNNRLYLERTGYPATPTSHPDKLPPYYRMDLNISKVISESLEITLDIRNLLNRENDIPMTSGRHGNFIEKGTSASLRAGYRF